MPSSKVVLIHTIRDSLTNLEDSIEFFRPDYVYLVTPESNAEDKPASAKSSIEEKDKQTLGANVDRIEHVEIRVIKKAWGKSTMLEVHQLLHDIKEDAQHRAKKDNAECLFHAGLSDAPGMLSPSMAFSAVLHNMSTYFTRGRRPYYDKEYVIEIDNLNNLTTVKNWLDGNDLRKRNLTYLEKIIELEERDVGVINTKILDEAMIKTTKAINTAMLKLEEMGLIRIEGGKRNRQYFPTELGRLIIKLELGGQS